MTSKTSTTVPVQEHQSSCPHCGYCPHCGRSNMRPWYPYPYGAYPYQWPYWQRPGITWTVTPASTVSATPISTGGGNYS